MLKEKSQTFFDGTTMLVGMKHCGAFFNSFVFHHTKKFWPSFLSTPFFSISFPYLLGKADRCQIKFVLKAKTLRARLDGSKTKNRERPKRIFLSLRVSIIDQKQCRPENGRETWTFWKNGLDGWDVELENGEMASEEACNQMLLLEQEVHSA